MPPISSKRLPFWHILSQSSVYKIINPELMADTLAIWLTIAPLLNLSQDDLVIVAIKNTVTKMLKKLPSNHFVVNQDNIFLLRIKTMLESIKEPEYSVDTAIWVTKNLPPGVNKVFCCNMAVKYTEQWISANPRERKASDMHEKLQSLLQLSHIERILHQYNSANDTTISYAKSPVQLIKYLIDDSCDSTKAVIKVCKISYEISKVASVNLNAMFFNFFYKWLTVSSCAVGNLDESTIDFAGNDLSEGESIDKNILRTINLLLGISAIDYDICENLHKKVQNMPSILRTRLIFCMVSVYGAIDIGKALKLSTSAMGPSSLSLCLCSSEIESLNLAYSIDMIASCNKVELVQRLLSDQCNNIKVLLLCVRLCLEYNIWEACIWNIYFQRLVELSMAETLENILQAAQGHLVHMWHYESFISAWKCVISSYFKDDPTNAVIVIEKVQKAILSCKCATYLDLASLWNDLRYFVKSASSKSLENVEQDLDVCSFVKALKESKELLIS